MSEMDTKKHEHHSSRIVKRKSGGRTPQYDYVYYYWDEINAGDCHQINGTLTFRSDGVANFDAVVWTDHTSSGDVWHSSFHVNQDNERPLLDLSNIDSPTTFGAHVPMHGNWTYDPSKFPSLPTDPHQVIQYSSC
jgi:hypothetical protein